jgi:hypothetical protein
VLGRSWSPGRWYPRLDGFGKRLQFEALQILQCREEWAGHDRESMGPLSLTPSISKTDDIYKYQELAKTSQHQDFG